MNAPQKPASKKAAQQFFKGLLKSLADEAGIPCKQPGNKCLPSNPRPDGTRICLWCSKEIK